MACKEMTLEEKLAIVVQSYKLRDEGKFEEADKMWKQIPLAPYLAKFCKEKIGVDFLIQCRYNLSEAEEEEEEYGKDWLTR